MGDSCRQCGRDARGSLCPACSERLADCDDLLPEHIVSMARAQEAAAWLVDPWGRPHPIRRDRTVIGRQAAGDIAIFHHTVSREHAVVYETGRGWTLRDLGSKNGTRVDGDRLEGRIALVDRVSVQLGKVPLVFRTLLSPDAIARGAASAMTTASVPDHSQWRCELRAPTGDRRLVLLRAAANHDELAGSVTLLVEGSRDVEVSLPAVEFELLRLLANRSRAVAAARSTIRRCVSTKDLARQLPFRSPHADEENVRQAVRRTRAALRRIGVRELIEAHPPHGYRITWTVC